MGQHGAGVGGDEGSLQKEGEHRRIESRSVARIPCQGQLYTPQAPPHPPHSGRSSGGAGNHHQMRQPGSLLLLRAQHSSMFSRFVRTQTLHQSFSVPRPQLLTTQCPHPVSLAIHRVLHSLYMFTHISASLPLLTSICNTIYLLIHSFIHSSDMH